MSQEEQLKQIIEEAWENRDSFAAGDTSPILRAAIAEVIRQLDCGQLRVAEKKNRRMDRQPVDQKGGSTLLPPSGKLCDAGRCRRLARAPLL